MKTATKVFLILSIVLDVILFIFMLVFAVNFLAIDINELYYFDGTQITGADAEYMVEYYHLIGSYFMGYAIYALILAILGGVVLWKVWTAKKKPGIGWSIITLLLVNLIAGILMLCSKEKDYNPNYIPENGYYNDNYGGPYDSYYNRQNGPYGNQQNDQYNGSGNEYQGTYSSNNDRYDEEDPNYNYAQFREDVDDDQND